MPISWATKADPHKIEVRTAQAREKKYVFTKCKYCKLDQTASLKAKSFPKL